MGKTKTGIRKLVDSDTELAAKMEAMAAAAAPPTPPAPPAEDLSLPVAKKLEQDDIAKARVFAKWGEGVAAQFFAQARNVQGAIIRNLAVAVQNGSVKTTGTNDGKAITPVNAELFAELRAKSVAFLASLPMTDRGLAAERVKSALGFILLMAEKNPTLDLLPEKAQAELAFRRIQANFFKDGLDFSPAVAQAEEAAQSASRATEDFLIGQLREKAERAGQNEDDVELFLTNEVMNLADPSDRRFKLIGRTWELDQLLKPAFTSRPTTGRSTGQRRPGDAQARFSRRG